MIFALVSQFHVYLLCLGVRLVQCLNVNAVVAAFNQEKALVGAFSVVVQLRRLIVYSTSSDVSAATVSIMIMSRCPPL